MVRQPKTILGIDPGVATTGFGLIRYSGGQTEHIQHGIISTSTKQISAQRLAIIAEGINQIIKKYQPQLVAVEDLFFCKNVKTALKVGQARGVVLLTIHRNKLPIYEYTPLQVKQAITGYGRADKKQVQEMAKTILGLKTLPQPDDAADALAIAICCAHSLKIKALEN